MPVLNLSGWHDEGYGPGSAARNFAGTRPWGGRLVIGPVDARHSDVRARQGLESSTSAAARASTTRGLLLRFFDRWLKGTANGLDREPPVRLFVMGDNVWRDESGVAARAGAAGTPYYLRAGGRLTREPPTETALPTATATTRPIRSSTRTAGSSVPSIRARSRARRDVLVYRSEALARDLEVTGPIEIELWASSSARDTDFVARLLDVSPGRQGLQPDEPDARGAAGALPERRGSPRAPGAGASR